jgi:hypothetical protein
MTTPNVVDEKQLEARICQHYWRSAVTPALEALRMIEFESLRLQHALVSGHMPDDKVEVLRDIIKNVDVVRDQLGVKKNEVLG